MYRSKRADRKYLADKLKFVAVCFMLVLIGGVVALGQNIGGIDEIIPALREFVGINTYVEEDIPEDGEFLDAPDAGEYQVSSFSEEFVETGMALLDYERTPRIALTFDDGPSRFTSDLLDILDEHGGKVTFCVIGNLVENGAATVVRAYEAGHEIIGHSWNHVDFARLNKDQMMEQVQRTSSIIDAVTGEPPPLLFRVPYGRFNSRIKDAATEIGYGILNWSIDPSDWQFRDEEHVYEVIMENACDGAIIVLHDIYPSTINAMARVIPELISQGFELVTATEIIYSLYGSIEPGFEHVGNK